MASSRLSDIQRRSAGHLPPDAGRELLFAGFPCHPQYRPAPSAAADDAAFTASPFSKKLLRELFERFGPVDAIHWDRHRGIGSVVFHDSPSAERCYFASHLDILPRLPPPQVQVLDDDDDGSRGGGDTDRILFLEFAQCCPFVNPILLARAVDDTTAAGGSGGGLAAGELGRDAILHDAAGVVTMGPPPAAAPVATHIVVRQQARQSGDIDGAAAVAPLNFPGVPIEPPCIAESLWRVLRPADATRQAPQRDVTVLDLWWEYYCSYGVRKTEPSADRIGDRQYDFAQRPSPLQTMLRAVEQAERDDDGDGDEGEAVTGARFLRRMSDDSLYHKTYVALLYKQKLQYDSSWASLMRDVYTKEVVARVAAFSQQEVKHADEEGSGRGGDGDGARRGISEADRAKLVQVLRQRYYLVPNGQREASLAAAAHAIWLEMPIAVAATNAMANVHFLHRVKRGEIDSKGHDIHRAHAATTTAAADNNADQQQQQSKLTFAEIWTEVQGFVSTGSADELVSLCEDPKLFRYAKGHIGYEEARQQPSSARLYLRALVVPLLVVAVVLFGYHKLAMRMGLGRITEQLQEKRAAAAAAAAKKEQRASSSFPMEHYTREQVEKAMERARKAGGRFNVEVRGDL